MIHELYTALTEAKVSPESARAAAEAVEKAIALNTDGAAKEMYIDRVVPLEKDAAGIRGEIRLLAETMENGFANAEKRMTALEIHIEKRIGSLEDQVEKRISSLEDQVEKRIGSLENLVEKQITALETTTTARIDSLEKRLDFHGRLLLWMLALIGGGFISVLGLLLKKLP